MSSPKALAHTNFLNKVWLSSFLTFRHDLKFQQDLAFFSLLLRFGVARREQQIALDCIRLAVYNNEILILLNRYCLLNCSWRIAMLESYGNNLVVTPVRSYSTDVQARELSLGLIPLIPTLFNLSTSCFL